MLACFFSFPASTLVYIICLQHMHALITTYIWVIWIIWAWVGVWVWVYCAYTGNTWRAGFTLVLYSHVRIYDHHHGPWSMGHGCDLTDTQPTKPTNQSALFSAFPPHSTHTAISTAILPFAALLSAFSPSLHPLPYATTRHPAFFCLLFTSHTCVTFSGSLITISLLLLTSV